MSATLGLVLDCADPDKLAQFWSAAIGHTVLGGAGSYVMQVDADGRQPKLLLQRVAEPKAGKNRMHFDIESQTVDASVTPSPPRTSTPRLRATARRQWTFPR